jgi:hypothetical protein
MIADTSPAAVLPAPAAESPALRFARAAGYTFAPETGNPVQLLSPSGDALGNFPSPETAARSLALRQPIALP